MMIDIPFDNPNDPVFIKKNIERINGQKEFLKQQDEMETDELIKAFVRLNVIGRSKAREYVQDLLDNPRYRRAGSDANGEG